MSELAYLKSIFSVIEFITESELRNTSKNLIRSYMKQSGLLTHIRRARYAVSRYTLKDLPSLESIQEKSQTQELDTIDHLILKMEWEAQRLDRAHEKRKSR